MKSSTRLDSATFQLTPTRTRCDLIISAKGKTEKIASGLLNPFLAHLKTAKEQLAKGGYSIVLEPEPNSNSTWFTKATVERFVRFVSTPEILERVYTIESEILQIEEAIVIQGHNDADMVDENQRKPVERVDGTRFILDTNEEKAIVLYEPGVNLPKENGSTATEENSKVKLMKVLETRKSVLQKEQGMAFARAVAAGFHVDDMSSLMSFSECFGALRLMDAGIKYIELWKKKHETGQWLEIEPTDAIASRSDFSAMNVSGVMLTDTANKQNEYGEVWVESHNEMCADGSRKVNNNMGADEKIPMTNQQPTGHQEYFPGQYPPHLYPPWPIHSPQSSVPVFHPYPMQGMPYYQNYAGNSPYCQSPYPIAGDIGLSADKKRGQRRHSMGSKDSNIDSETGEVDSSNMRVQDDLDMNYGTSEDRELQKKGHKSGKKKAGTVVIRNINFISSRKHDISGGEESVTDEEDGESEINNSETKSKNSLKFSRTERNSENLSNRSGKFDQEGSNILGNEANGHWQAFENFLLKDADEHSADKDMFTKENEGKPKRRLKKVGDDLLVFGERDNDEIHDETIMDVNKFSGKVNRLPKSIKDESLISKKGSVYDSRPVDGRVQYTELEGRRTAYKQTGHDDFMVTSNKDSVSFPSDLLAINGFDRRSKHLDRKSSNCISDSYIVSLNSSSLDQIGNGCINAIDMDSEFPSAVGGTYNMSHRVTSQLNYTPDELILMPERGMEKDSTGYDHALKYEMQIQVGNNPSKESAAADVKKESSKLDRDRKLKTVADGSDKRKTGGPMRRGKPSKLSPLDEARVRAEKLRTYKADLQKMKREKEVEEKKRLEALKMERQKRISSRGTSAQPSLPSHHSKKHTPTKLSPSSLKGSKFTDSEPGSLSPLQRSTRKNNSVGSSASIIASKPSRSNTERDANRLSKSVSSLPEPKKENGSLTNSNKASMTRMRRLSEPKTSSTSNAAVKSQALEPLSKQKKIDGSEKKKISAIIVNHDRSKAATLPELKIKTSIKPDTTLGGPVAKELAQNVGSSTSEGAHIEIRNDTSHYSEGDDNPVIEKTVLMLECGSKKPFVPKERALDEKLLTVADIEGIEHQSPDLPFPYEVALSNAEKETPKFSVSRAAEKPYNAPYARLSSLEDPSTRMSDYGKAPPTNLELAAPDSGSKAHVSNFGNSKLGKVPAFEKPEVKESSRGFKRLLKFGRKNNSSAKGEHNMESDNVSIHSSEADDSETNTAVSNEVHTLKNLISQEETAAASTSQKSSRTFSLLSPFRKSNDKKLVVL